MGQQLGFVVGLGMGERYGIYCLAVREMWDVLFGCERYGIYCLAVREMWDVLLGWG